MAIKFKCPSCSKKLKYEDSYGGVEMACPQCQQWLEVPMTKAQQQAQQVAAAEQQQQVAAQQAAAHAARKAAIIISTGAIDRPHTVLQIVFAAGIQKFGGKGMFTADASYISDVKYNEMIEQVYVSAIDTFRDKGARAGADAIVHSNFDIEQIEMHESGLLSDGNALRIQVFCTGTAVRFT